MAGGVTQVVELLPSKGEALSSIFSNAQNKEKPLKVLCPSTSQSK
jgi:hypothetical protein